MPSKRLCTWWNGKENEQMTTGGTKFKKCSLGRGRMEAQKSKRRQRKSSSCGTRCGENDLLVRLQPLVSKEYILSRVFRKDGPPLGVEFDPLPRNAFGLVADTEKTHCDEGTQRALKRKKVLKSSNPETQRFLESNISEKKYGMGKALMTVWQATNSRHGKFPNGKNLIDGLPFASSNEVLRQKQDRIKKKMPKKTPRRRKAPENIDANHKSSHHIKCGLLVDEVHNVHQSTLFTPLVDDEDLELRELEPASTSLKCSSHLGLSGQHGCPLCKDLLARFPPRIVKMKQPIAAKPWDSSPELVKKLLVVFRFLYSHANSIGMCTFTLDELAQAFTDKDSLLLGKIHVGLLKLLLLGMESEIATGFISTGSRDCRFLSFLHFVREQEFDVNIWTECLNSLSWTEILRQVLTAAGYGSKQNSVRRDLFNKERSRMAKYGLCPRTLKGELFSILLKQGSLGSKVSELAKAPQIVTLDTLGTQKEQEELIYSTLSSDITLFEKIGPTAYRLRVNPQIKGNYGSQSDDDLGGVEDESSDADTSRCSDDSEGENSVLCRQKIVKYKSKNKGYGQKLIEHNEIDESYSGEAWFLGLMEGDYSNLSTEEKLDILVALVDLVGASSSIRTAESSVAMSKSATSMPCRGSGAKIKRLPCLSKSTSSNIRKVSGIEKMLSVGDCFQSDSLLAFSNAKKKGQSSGSTEAVPPDVHPPKSVFLGSDRRYNNYWLFLGPCEKSDPGHRRIYFESSEDGNWQVIDTTQALRDLLLALDCRGTRESQLFASLEKREAFLCQAMDDFFAAEYRRRQTAGSNLFELSTSSGDGSSPISDVDNILASAHSTNSCSLASEAVVPEVVDSSKEKTKRWDRLQAYDRWIWSCFYSTLNAVKNYKRPYMESLTRCESCHDLYWRDEKHCKLCHTTFEMVFDLDERYAIHVATCREITDTRDFPAHKVLPSQLQALKAAVHVIEGSMPASAFSRAWKSSAHKLWVKRLRRTSSLPELMQVLADLVTAMNEEWLYENVLPLHSAMPLDEIMVYFQTMPQTTSAVALWIVKLDRLIAPYLEKVQSEITLPCKPRLKGK